MVATTHVNEKVINELAIKCLKPNMSMAGSLKKYVGKLSKQDILKDLRDKNVKQKQHSCY